MIELTESGEGIWHIELRRPEKRNALGVAAYAALADNLQRIAADANARVVLLSGQGPSFCAGNDLGEFATHWPQPADGPVIRFMKALHAMPLPVIAAVQGAAVGIGATMLLHCDLVVAARDTYLQFPFIDRGIAPEAASTLLLPRRLGHGRAMDLLLTGRRVGAEEALTLGLVTHLADNEQSFGNAMELARDLAAKPPAALRMTKQLVRLEPAETVTERFTREIAAINQLLEQLPSR